MKSIRDFQLKKYTIAFLAGGREQGENKNILGLYLDNLFSGSPLS
ncbi:hypothetical protein NIES2107_04160 [Nostoc carneum NIES-2107]|nr:hypothetical protein NIES2107_04160 [Nostoc carneum NIES-2107]